VDFIEEHPAVFVVAVMAVVEAWIRVREPLFRRLAGLRPRRDSDAC
jgi:hypothetical protein